MFKTLLTVDKYFCLLTGIICFALFIGIHQLQYPMIAEADAYSRVNVAMEQIRAGDLFNDLGGVWLPLHFSLLYIAISLFEDPIITSRIVTLIFSTASIISVYHYSLAYKNHKGIALVSAAVFAVLPLRIFLTTQTLSEPIFIFFLITALALVLRKKVSQPQLILSLVLLNIAHGIRYESWMILPLLFLYIFLKKIPIKQKILYISTTTFFPIYWLYANYKHTNNFKAFFDIKYETAQKFISPYYNNLKLSFFAWEQKLLATFPLTFSVLALSGLGRIFKKNSPEQILIMSLPIYLFFALVIQVYSGTMEWFPTRYLLIPITLLIPLLSSTLHILYNKAHKTFLKLSQIHQIVFVVIATFFLGILIISYCNSYTYTKLETTDWSFLESYNTTQILSNHHKYADFVEILHKCQTLCGQTITYVYNDDSRTYLDQALFYFLNRKGIDASQSNVTQYMNAKILVWESLDLNNRTVPENMSTIFSNQTFMILKQY